MIRLSRTIRPDPAAAPLDLLLIARAAPDGPYGAGGTLRVVTWFVVLHALVALLRLLGAGKARKLAQPIGLLPSQRGSSKCRLKPPMSVRSCKVARGSSQMAKLPSTMSEED